jgi:hypothetical protein
MRSQKYDMVWTGYPHLEQVRKWDDGRPVYKLLTPFSIFIKCNKTGISRWYTIPQGYEYDNASIPRFAWSIFHPADARWSVAAILHDWLYAAEWCPKKQSDDMFLCAMYKGGTQAVHRATMYAAVAMFGGVPYRKHRLENVMAERALSGIDDNHRPFVSDLLNWSQV